jgi:hypothetical protein
VLSEPRKAVDMREVQIVTGLKIETARIAPGDEMKWKFRKAVPVLNVTNEYLLAEEKIEWVVVPVHMFHKVIGHEDGVMGPNSEPIVETKYLAYSPEVLEYLGEPLNAMQEQMLAYEANWHKACGLLAKYDGAPFFSRLKYLFTGSL